METHPGIEYRVEIWATSPSGQHDESWSGTFTGDAWQPATDAALENLSRRGWSAFRVYRNGLELELRPKDISLEEHDELDILEDQEPELAALRGIDGDEQRMLFR